VAFSPDGRTLATGHWDSTVTLWDVATGQRRAAASGPRSLQHLVHAAFSPDGKSLVTVRDDSEKLWKWDGVTLREHATVGTGWAGPPAFSPDGKTLFVEDKNGAVKLWDVATGKEVAALERQPALIGPVAFSPDGKHSASWANRTLKHAAKLKDLDTGQERALVYPCRVYTVVFSPDGKTVAVGSEDATIKLWDVTPATEPAELAGHVGAIRSLALSADGKTLASGGEGEDHTIRLWDVVTGQNRGILKGHQGFVSSVAFSPNGRALATGSSDWTVKLWDLPTGHERATLTGHTHGVACVAFSRDGRTLASGNGVVKLWDVATGKVRWMLRGYRSVAFSPDGKTLAVPAPFGGVLLFDAATGGPGPILQPGDRGAWHHTQCVAFSPDGKALAGANGFGTVNVWDMVTGQLRLALKAHRATVTSLAFVPDGKALVSASEDGTLKLWDLATGQERFTLKGPKQAVHAVAVARDGKLLVTLSGDGKVRLWRAASGAGALARKSELDRKDPDNPNVRINWADSLREARRFQDAEPVYRAALARLEGLLAACPGNPDYRADSANAHIGLARLLTATDRPREAEDAYRRGVSDHEELAAHSRAMDRDPKDAAFFWSVRGKINFLYGRWKEAVSDYSRAIELRPDVPAYRLARSNAYSKLGRWDKAIADGLEAAGASEPGAQDAESWIARGDASSRQGQLQEAVSYYSRAIELRPRRPAYWIHRGDTYAALGQYKEAIADYSKAIDLAPKVALAWFNRGRAYAALKEWDKAADDYSRAIEREPKEASFWNQRGGAHSWRGRWAEAVGDYTRAIALKPGSPAYRMNRGEAHGRLKRWDKAADDYSTAIELGSKNADSWNGRGIANYNLGQWQQAVADHSKAIELKANVPDYWGNRGTAYTALKELGKASDDLARALDLDDQHAHSWNERGNISFSYGQFAEAVFNFTRAIALKPDRLAYRRNRGNAYAALKEWDKAADDYSRAIELKNDDPVLRYQLALVRLARGDRDGYRQACSDMLKRFGESSNAEVADLAAWVCVLGPDAVSEWKLPRQLAEKALAKGPKSGDPPTTLGALLYRAGRFKEGVRRLAEAELAFKEARGPSQSGVINCRLFQAMTEYRLGHVVEARRRLDQAVKAIEQALPENARAGEASRSPLPWNRRLTFQLLRHEAEALLGSKRSR
jgi:WD40 repeat protein/predicted Zn-dependent protease